MCASICARVCVCACVRAYSKAACDEQQPSISRARPCLIFTGRLCVNRTPLRHGDKAHLRAKLGVPLL